MFPNTKILKNDNATPQEWQVHYLMFNNQHILHERRHTFQNDLKNDKYIG